MFGDSTRCHCLSVPRLIQRVHSSLCWYASYWGISRYINGEIVIDFRNLCIQIMICRRTQSDSGDPCRATTCSVVSLLSCGRANHFLLVDHRSIHRLISGCICSTTGTSLGKHIQKLCLTLATLEFLGSTNAVLGSWRQHHRCVIYVIGYCSVKTRMFILTALE